MPTVVEFSTAQLDLLCGVLRTSGRTVTKTTLAATHDAGAQEVRGVDLYRHDHQTKSRIYYVHRNGKWVPPREHRTKIAYANALVGLAGLVTNWRSSNGEFKKTTRVVVLNKLYINAEMVLKDFDWDGLYGAVFAQRRGDEAAVAAFLTDKGIDNLAEWVAPPIPATPPPPAPIAPVIPSTPVAQQQRAALAHTAATAVENPAIQAAVALTKVVHDDHVSSQKKFQTLEKVVRGANQRLGKLWANAAALRAQVDKLGAQLQSLREENEGLRRRHQEENDQLRAQVQELRRRLQCAEKGHVATVSGQAASALGDSGSDEAGSQDASNNDVASSTETD